MDIFETLPIYTCGSTKFTEINDACVAAVENPLQSEMNWLNFANILLPRRNISSLIMSICTLMDIPVKSRGQTRECDMYVIIEPFHTSVYIQVAEVGIN